MDLRARVETLNEQRLRAWEQGKALLEATEGRKMDAEELATYERINTEMDDIDAEVRQLVESETREKEAATLREQTLEVFGEQGARDNDKAGADVFRQWLNAPRGSELRASDFTIDIARVAKERDLIRQGAGPDEIRALAWDASSGSTRRTRSPTTTSSSTPPASASARPSCAPATRTARRWSVCR